MFAVLLLVGIISIFKSYPSLGDFALWHALLATYSELVSRARLLVSASLHRLITKTHRPAPPAAASLPNALRAPPLTDVPPPVALLGLGQRQLLLREHARVGARAGRAVGRLSWGVWATGGTEGIRGGGEGEGASG